MEQSGANAERNSPSCRSQKLAEKNYLLLTAGCIIVCTSDTRASARGHVPNETGLPKRAGPFCLNRSHRVVTTVVRLITSTMWSVCVHQVTGPSSD